MAPSDEPGPFHHDLLIFWVGYQNPAENFLGMNGPDFRGPVSPPMQRRRDGVLDAGLVCTASLPCPAEMGGSIHIHGTTSSIIDTVFVCRASEPAEADWRAESPEQLAAIVSDDLAALAATGRRATLGDTRCIVFGHLTRLAVRELRKGWNPTLPTAKKLAAFADAIGAFGGAELGCASTAQAQP